MTIKLSRAEISLRDAKRELAEALDQSRGRMHLLAVRTEIKRLRAAVKQAEREI